MRWHLSSPRLVASGKHSVLVIENLAERTLALAQLARRVGPARGCEPLLQARLRPIPAGCLRHNIAFDSSFGTVNTRGTTDHVLRLAAEPSLPSPRVVVV